MKPASRERKERFLNIGGNARQIAVRAISARILREGLDWLTDEQLTDIASDILAEERARCRRNIRNRKIIRGAA